MTRRDVDTKALAESWLAGRPILALALDFDLSTTTVSKRLKAARQQFPDLAWNQRRPTVRGESPTQQYRMMNDGVPNTSDTPKGSIIPARSRRPRTP